MNKELEDISQQMEALNAEDDELRKRRSEIYDLKSKLIAKWHRLTRTYKEPDEGQEKRVHEDIREESGPA